MAFMFVGILIYNRAWNWLEDCLQKARLAKEKNPKVQVLVFFLLTLPEEGNAACAMMEDLASR